MQIKLTESEAKELIGRYLLSTGTIRGTLTITIEHEQTNLVALPSEPIDVDIAYILRRVRNWQNRLTDNKIPCIKSIREEARTNGFNIPLAQAKWFVEEA